ncbi:MAG TPA: 5-deoxy-glucuronate isomerase, partial [Kineosporiaceae bacterium]|nr:5-deoxy-glucuronate isomerase [Kineosporiaceae bacterium]
HEDVVLTPDAAGWAFAGLRVVTLPPQTPVRIATGDSEVVVLPLSGSAEVAIAAADAPDVVEVRYHLEGRDSVFTAATDFAYAGRDSVLGLVSDRGAEIALPAARCGRRLPPARGERGDVAVEVRGAGRSTRLVRNFAVPGAWDHAVTLMSCEVVTPPGNWSSHPPHKHDASAPCPVAAEEIYYYRIAGPDQVTPSPKGIGMHRTYTGLEHAEAGLPPLDETFEVRDGDVVLVPHGFHGPCAAAPGYPMYYLNVLAGPGAERSMTFCDDPAHAWIRGSWPGQPPDPRVLAMIRIPTMARRNS